MTYEMTNKEKERVITLNRYVQDLKKLAYGSRKPQSIIEFMIRRRLNFIIEVFMTNKNPYTNKGLSENIKQLKIELKSGRMTILDYDERKLIFKLRSAIAQLNEETKKEKRGRAFNKLMKDTITLCDILLGKEG